MPKDTIARVRADMDARLDTIETMLASLLDKQERAQTQAPKRTEPARDDSVQYATLKPFCSEFGLNEKATEGTILKFNGWCTRKKVSSAQYGLYVLRSHRGPSLRWFQKQPTNAVTRVPEHIIKDVVEAHAK